MNPDDQMDDRLRAAGQRWQDANNEAVAPSAIPTTAAEPIDITDIPITRDAPRRAGGRAYWIAGVAALVALATSIGIAVSVSGNGSNGTAADGGTSAITGPTWQLVAAGTGKPPSQEEGWTMYSPLSNSTDQPVTVTGHASASVSYSGTYVPGLIGSNPCFRTPQAPAANETASSCDIDPGFNGSSPSAAAASSSADSRVVFPVATQNSSASLRIGSDGKVSGGDGCNSFSGTAKVDGNAIDFGDLATTEMGCPEANTKTISITDKVLAGKVTWLVRDDELLLTKAGVGWLGYVATPPTPTEPTSTATPSDLTGTTWALNTVETDSGNSGSASGGSDYASLTLSIDSGQIQVSTGCATATGPVTVKAKQLVIGALAEPAIGCTNAVLSDADAATLTKVLSGTVDWAIDNGELTLIKSGVGKLVYQPKDSASPVPVVPPPTAGASASASSTSSSDPDELSGQTWQLQGIEIDSGNSSSGDGSSDYPSVTIAFPDARSGTVVVNVGCGPERGSVDVAQGTAAFTGLDLVGAVMNCSSSILGENDLDLFAKVLDGRATFTVDGDVLHLVRAGGGITANFTAAPLTYISGSEVAPPAGPVPSASSS